MEQSRTKTETHLHPNPAGFNRMAYCQGDAISHNVCSTLALQYVNNVGNMEILFMILNMFTSGWAYIFGAILTKYELTPSWKHHRYSHSVCIHFFGF